MQGLYITTLVLGTLPCFSALCYGKLTPDIPLHYALFSSQDHGRGPEHSATYVSLLRYYFTMVQVSPSTVTRPSVVKRRNRTLSSSTLKPKPPGTTILSIMSILAASIFP